MPDPTSALSTAPGLGPTRPDGEPFPPGGHIAVVRLDGAGDVLLTGPAVRAVAARAHAVTVVAGPGGAEAAALLPGVDAVEVLDAPWVALEPAPLDRKALLRTVALWDGAPFDGAVILTSAHQSPLPTALLLKLAGVPLVAGTSVDHAGRLLDVRLRVAPGHEVERNLALARAAGYPGDGDTTMQVRRPPPSAVDVPAGAVVVHPGASVPSRRLPAAAAADLVRRLVAEDVPVVLTGTAEETAPLASEAAGRAVDLGGRTDLAALTDVLSRAAVLVVGNTGPAHLAAAVGTPVVSVFAPVVPPEGWRPWTTRLATLGDATVACAGCRARSCPFADQPCTAAVDGPALHAAVAWWRERAPLLAGSPA